MNLDLINNIFNNLKDNKVAQNFINELSNYLENNIESNSKNDRNVKWNNLMENDLTLYGTKIITKFKNEMLIERNNILQNYANNIKEEGEMYYIYNTSQDNLYNLSICEEGKSHDVITKKIEELPEGATLGSVLTKQQDKFVLNIEATEIVEKEINNMIKEKIEEQKEYLESKRIDGHIYEVGEKYFGRIFLYDTNNITNGGLESFEEIEFPQDLYEVAQEGDKFIYTNGQYEKYKK